MTGYVRKDTTNNIADGNVINAADLDAEFDGVQDAFNASTGHNHDGTTGEGAPITALGPTQDVTISAILLAPKTNNTVDIGSSSLKFKDLFLAGNGSIGGTLAVTGVATLTAQPILSSLTASRAVFTDGSKGLVSNAITGTGNVVMSASPTLTGTIDAAAATLSGNLTLSGGTANGVAYLNGSKVVTSGSALTFDGTNLGVGGTGAVPLDVYANSSALNLRLRGRSADSIGQMEFWNNAGSTRYGYVSSESTAITLAGGTSIPLVFATNGSEAMRLTSTGLGIGTSSPDSKLHVVSGASSTLAQLRIGYNGTSVNYYDANTHYFRDGNGPTDRMTLDSSGNLGLGVTPSAWGIGKAIQIAGSTGFLGFTGVNGNIVTNTYYDGSNYRYIATSAAFLYEQSAGHKWSIAPSGTAGNAITFTQAMTLDASGNLLLGSTSSPSTVWSSSRTFAYVKGGAAGNGGEVIVESNNGNQQASFFASGISGEFGLWSTKASAIVFGNSNTERARIDSSGNFYVLSNVDGIVSASTLAAGTSNNIFLGKYSATTTTNGTTCYAVRTNGNVINTNNSYGAISDIKLKENIVDASPKLADLMQVKVRSYNLIGDTTKQLGVVAQELQTVFPAMVDESSDQDEEGNDLGTTTKSVKYSVFVPMLIKAIQELKAEFDAYKASHP